MMRRWMAALAAASLLAIAATGPEATAAQSCADFGSEKEAQRYLERSGDPSGQLDPDGNGFACDGQTSGGGLAVDQSGQPGIYDSAAGASGVTTIVGNPGRERTDDRGGERNRERNRDQNDDAAAPAADPAPAPADPAPTDAGAPAAPDAPADDATGGQVIPVGDGTAAETSATRVRPIRLPSTGAGTAGGVGFAAPLALIGLLAAGALASGRLARQV